MMSMVSISDFQSDRVGSSPTIRSMNESFTLDDILNYVAIKGIVHIGGHNAEERDFYGMKLPVLWVEGHPDYATKMIENLKWEPWQVGYEALLSDVDDVEVDFWITKDEFASSMFKPKEHQDLFPHAPIVDKIRLRTKRFDTFIKENDIDINKYNVLVLDVQGAELQVLKGLGEYFQYFPVIISEFSRIDLYENGPRLSDLYEYLNIDYDMVMHDPNTAVGDAMFVRRK